VFDALFPGILVHLIGLDHVVSQRITVAPPQGEVLGLATQFQEVLAVAAQLAGQLRRGDALGDPAEDEHDLGGTAMRSRQ